MLEKLFHLSENKTSVKTELLAGVTIFMTMAYILAVNPGILSAAGMDKEAVFTATALSAALATAFMGLLANLPIALAPGMGLNAFFAFAIVLGMGYSWQMALTAVFLEGLLFLILTFFNIREIIVNSIPQTIKNAMPVGIGFFIALIGFKGAGIVTEHPATLITLGNVKEDASIWVALIGLLLTGTLVAMKKDYAILAGILVSTLIGIPLGITSMPENIMSVPPSIAPVFNQFTFDQIFTSDMLIIVLTLLFVDIFDTIGTLVAVASKIGAIKPNGSFPKMKKAMFADALGTVCGAFLGTSTVTSYIESAAGVASGGRTGLTAMSTAVMFLIALLFAPLFLSVPAAATAPALIIVGVFMISSVLNVDFDDFTESIPAFLTMVLIPYTYNIANGIVFGIISYVIIKTATGKVKQVTVTTAIIAGLLTLNLFFGMH